jgi:hypothetical protein
MDLELLLGGRAPSVVWAFLVKVGLPVTSRLPITDGSLNSQQATLTMSILIPQI